METEQLGSFLELEKTYTAFIEGKEPDATRTKKLHDKISSLIADEQDNSSLRIRAYSIILKIEEKQLIHTLPLNFVMFCGKIPDLFATNTYKKWKEIDELHTRRLQSLLKYCLDTHYFLASSNIAMDISEWTYQKLFIFYVLKNWDTKTLTVKGKLNGVELDILAKEVDRIDKVIKGYEMLEHRENMVHALSFKYELLNFSDRMVDANVTSRQIESLIEKYDMNALKPIYQSLITGDSRYKKFITFFIQHMNGIYRIAKNSGIGKYFIQPISPEYLKNNEFLDKGANWFKEDFFDLAFPVVDIGQHT
jgi:hypothetical protein